MKQVCINTKRAAAILEISLRQAQRLFRMIRKENKKEKHQYVTVREFCAYTGLDEEDVGKVR